MRWSHVMKTLLRTNTTSVEGKNGTWWNVGQLCVNLLFHGVTWFIKQYHDHFLSPVFATSGTEIPKFALLVQWLLMKKASEDSSHFLAMTFVIVVDTSIGGPKEHFEHYESWDPNQLLCFTLINMVISSLPHAEAAIHEKLSLMLSNHPGKTSHPSMVVSNQLLTYCKVENYFWNHFRDTCQEFIVVVCSIFSCTKMTQLCWEYWTDLPSADLIVSQPPSGQ